MPPEHPLHRSPSFHARFSDKVRNMKFLKKPFRSALASPTITESSGESSEDAASSSASSVLESHSTSLSVPSTSSFSQAVTQRQPPDRPWLGRSKSGCYSSRHQSMVVRFSPRAHRPTACRVRSMLTCFFFFFLLIQSHRRLRYRRPSLLMRPRHSARALSRFRTANGHTRIYCWCLGRWDFRRAPSITVRLSSITTWTRIR